MTSQIPLQTVLYRVGHGTEKVMKTNSTNPEEDKFNESLVILLNGQQDL